MPITFEAESWSMRHGSKDCDHGVFATREAAERFLSSLCNSSYAQTIVRCEGDKRETVYEDPIRFDMSKGVTEEKCGELAALLTNISSRSLREVADKAADESRRADLAAKVVSITDHTSHKLMNSAASMGVRFRDLARDFDGVNHD